MLQSLAAGGGAERALSWAWMKDRLNSPNLGVLEADPPPLTSL